MLSARPIIETTLTSRTDIGSRPTSRAAAPSASGIAAMPASSGKSAAVRLPNTTTRTTNVTGSEQSSAARASAWLMARIS